MSNTKLCDPQKTFQEANNLPTSYRYTVIGIKGYFISFIHREFIGFQLTKSSVKIEAGRGRTLVNRTVVNDSHSSWSVFQFLTLRSFPDISKPGIRTQFLFYASMKKNK